ncbi:hypothetical protein ACJ41O_013965 [Fusarium nematophilum]
MAGPMEEDTFQLAGEDETGHEAGPSTSRRTPGGSPSRRRNERKLLETIALALHFGFESLPADAQQAYLRFKQDNSFGQLATDLSLLLNSNALDDFLNASPAFLHAAAELFGPRYPHLRLQELCEERWNLDEQEEAPPKRRPSAFGRSYRPRWGAKTAHRRNDQHAQEDEPIDVAAARTSRTLTLGSRDRTRTRTRSRRTSRSRTQRWVQTTRPAPSQATQATAGPSTEVPDTAAAGGETEPSTGTQPLIPGETQRQSRDEYNRNWLRYIIGNEGAEAAPIPEFTLQPYKGWSIEGPELQLLRAKNFLADEDADRTIGWPRKFAELAEYFEHLQRIHKGEDWGADLKEAIDMLHTHWVFETYHYGRPRLNFEDLDSSGSIWPKKSNRLPRVPGGEVSIEARDGPDDDDMGERRLLYGPIASAHDVHYEMPPGALEKYVREYERDAREFWATLGQVQPRVDRRNEPDIDVRYFNMVESENEVFERCVSGDRRTTCAQLERYAFQTDSSIIEVDAGRAKPDVDSLRQFSRFRGARRAALQQCLNHFDNHENLRACNIWRTLVLPLPKVPEKPDAGVIFPVMQVADVPKKEAHDPFRYTVTYRWYTRMDRYWADWVYGHSIKEAYGHKRWAHRKEPIMDLPPNFKGPVVHDFMDKEMKKTRALLISCCKIWEGILRANKRATRELLSQFIHFALCGLEGTDWNGLGLQFRVNELVDGPVELAHIRPEEEDWLRFLAGDSVNAAMVGVKQGVDRDEEEDRQWYHQVDGDHTDIFEERVEAMMKDVDPKSLFCDLDDMSFNLFLKELNRDCDGPVRRWRFSQGEAIREAERLSKKGKIGFQYVDGSPCVFRPEVTCHPEDLIQWFDSDNESASESEEQPVEPTNDTSADVDDEDDAFTISTIVTVPESEDLGPYTEGIPKMADLRSWPEAIRDRASVLEDQPRTVNFYNCLAYRLGKTVRDLRAKNDHDMKQLTPEQKLKNLQFLEDVTGFWLDDAAKLPNNPKKNPGKVGSHLENRVTGKYRDIVEMADREAFDAAYPKTDGFKEIFDFQRHDEEALEMVRKAILQEACENKTMLFPSRVEHLVTEDGKTVSLPPRRDPVWAFGLDESRGKAQRFWDVNRWPVHLQSDKTREKIRLSKWVRDVGSRPTAIMSLKGASQGERHPPTTPRAPLAPMTETDVTNLPDTAEEQQARPATRQRRTVTYADRAQSRRRFRPGPPEYWLGDTPLQKKAIEDALKGGLETTRAPSRSWRQRLASLFGREAEDDPTALPHVSPRDIPKSKPRSEPLYSPSDPDGEGGGGEDQVHESEGEGNWEEVAGDAALESDEEMPSVPPSATFPPPTTPVNPSVLAQASAAGQADPTATARALSSLSLGQFWTSRSTRHLLSHPVRLEIEEPGPPEEPEQPGEDGDPEFYRDLYGRRD